MRLIALIGSALVWCAASAGSTVHAQEATRGAPSAALDEEARALFEAGRVAYEDGRYSDALGYFQRAYELSQRPGLQYNLGLAYDRLRRDQEALQAFEAYLASEPEHERAVEVQNRVRALKDALAQAPPEPVSVAATPAAPAPVTPRQDTSRSARTRKRWMWAGIAVGVLVVGAGITVGGVLAADHHASGRPAPNSGVTFEALSWH
jgi:tetratricopeptide (TPR) repeat protein